jgi:exonuclease SbcD
MKIAVIGDSHFDETSRFDECVRIHEWIAQDIRARGVELVLHAGDVFERKSTPRERRAVADWLRSVADVAPVVVVRGNHDVVGDLSIFSRLRTRHPITVEEGAATYVVAGVAVACLAWPRKAELLSRLGTTSHEQGELGAREALRAVLLGLGQQLAEFNGPRVLLSHAMVRGSRVSTGQPLLGCDMELGLEDLSLVGADAIALGHIHLGQDWSVENDGAIAPVFYPGSPRRTAYGETESKGYVVVSVDEEVCGWKRGRGQAAEGRAMTWERIETPCAPMLLLTGEFVGSSMDPNGPDRVDEIWYHPDSRDADVQGAEVRVRYLVTSDERGLARADEARLRADLVARGAAAVKIEAEVVATSTARAPEVAAAVTLAAKLHAVWRARGDIPDEARAARLISMAHGLEEDAARAA